MVAEYGERFDIQISLGIKPLKFVPASGAASRMFEDLFEALAERREGEDLEITLAKNTNARKFLVNKDKFAFFSDLKKAIADAGEVEICGNWIGFLLYEKGLNYGNLPKGMLKFHKYPDGERTLSRSILPKAHIMQKAGIMWRTCILRFHPSTAKVLKIFLKR